MYSHTTGPNESPKLAMKANKPIRMKTLPSSGMLALKMKPKAMRVRDRAAAKVPKLRIVALP